MIGLSSVQGYILKTEKGGCLISCMDTNAMSSSNIKKQSKLSQSNKLKLQKKALIKYRKVIYLIKFQNNSIKMHTSSE